MKKIFLKSVAVLGTVAILATPSFAAKKVKWKLAMTWPSTLTPLSTPPQKLAARIKEMSGGKFTIEVHGKEKHKAPLAVLDMVKNKQYEIGHTSSYYYKGKSISTALLTTTPFGMTSTEQYAWYYYGGGEALTKKVYDKFKINSYPGGNTGIQMGGWFKKEIKSLDDLKGLKMRIPGMAGEVFAKLGVNVTNIPAGELYTALDRGTIDALEWVGPSMDIKMGFHKVAPYYYTSWNKPASQTQFLINKSAYKKLPFQYQTILKTAIKTASHELYYENFYESLKAWEKIQTDFPNIKIKTLPKNVLEDLKRSKELIFQQYSKENKLFQEIYNNQKEFISKARKWSQLEEYSYLKSLNELNKKQ